MTPLTGTPAIAGPLEETITLRQAKTLIKCMAHQQSFLLLSPPGAGKSEMVYQAAAEARLPCRSLLGTQIAPEDVSGIPRIVCGATNPLQQEEQTAARHRTTCYSLRSVLAPR